jgi:pSer/pThr/pTyr-binding forkhead associated (FHA) protein
VQAAFGPRRGNPTHLGAAGSRAVRDDPAGRLVSLTNGREYVLNVAPFVLGRDETAQVVVASPDASRRHAEIVHRPDGDVLVDLSKTGTLVNGKPIEGRRVLRPLDVIRIGAEEFRYYPPAISDTGSEGLPPGAEFRLGDTLVGMPAVRSQSVARTSPSPKPLASLLVKNGSAKGERLQVRAPVVSLGREDFNDLKVADPSVSAAHAKIQLREGVWVIDDLGSTNGTSVDGERIAEETPLSPGATLRIGDVSLLFEPLDEGFRLPPPTLTRPLSTAPSAPALSTPSAPSTAPPSRGIVPERRASVRAVVPPPSRREPPPAARSRWMAVVIVGVVVALAALAALVLFT